MKSPTTPLNRLAALRWQYGGLAGERLALLRALERRRLRRAADVAGLHELLCVLLAYPDDRAVFEQAARMLRAFEARPDLRRFRDDLVDTGIAGTVTFYRFEAPTARWLASRWADRLTVDWDEVDEARVARHLTLFSLAAECPGLDEPPLDLHGRAWLDRLRGREPDAAFLIRRAADLGADELVRHRIYDELSLMLRLDPGPGTPSRSRARYDRSPFTPQAGPMRAGRPDLAAEAVMPPLAVRRVSPREGARLIDLAREAMVARSRDLHAFEFASARDVSLIECGGGLQFACVGVQPEHRHLLEAVYAFLLLRNGVPIGYALASALFRSSEIAFNIFETYRRAEAAFVYGRLLGAVRALFGSDTFSVPPYQLGHENEEGIESGAWWFYHKLGFRPRDRETRRIMRRELARMRRRPSHRSSHATLRRLVRHFVFLSLEGDRDDVMGSFAGDAVGLAATDFLNERFGPDRGTAARQCADEAAQLLQAGAWRRWAPGERLAWTRLSPIVLMLPGVARWPAADRRALAALVRAKGSRREIRFVKLANEHPRFHRALAQLGRNAERSRQP
jgi:hypothetical protein